MESIDYPLKETTRMLFVKHLSDSPRDLLLREGLHGKGLDTRGRSLFSLQ